MNTKIDRELVLVEYCHLVEKFLIVLGSHDYQKRVMGARSAGCAWELKSDLISHIEFLARNGIGVLNEGVLVDLENINAPISAIDPDNPEGMDNRDWVQLRRPVNEFLHNNKLTTHDIGNEIGMLEGWSEVT